MYDTQHLREDQWERIGEENRSCGGRVGGRQEPLADDLERDF